MLKKATATTDTTSGGRIDPPENRAASFLIVKA